MIRAFATRTASVRVDRCFGYGVFSCPPGVGIMGSNGVAAIEPCAPGCTLMGPGDVGLRFGIMNNACVPSLFDAPASARPVPIVVIQVPQYNSKQGGYNPGRNDHEKRQSLSCCCFRCDPVDRFSGRRRRCLQYRSADVPDSSGHSNEIGSGLFRQAAARFSVQGPVRRDAGQMQVRGQGRAWIPLYLQGRTLPMYVNTDQALPIRPAC